MYNILRNIRKMNTKSMRVSPGYSHMPTASITNLKLNTEAVAKQPVPDLKKTAERYLKSVRPLLCDAEYDDTEAIMEQFVCTPELGPYLHGKLLEKAKKTDNWMSDWWLKAAYLGYRSPVIVHSSPGSVGPPMNFKDENEMCSFATHLILAVCEYDRMVKSGKMKQEKIKDTPLDMQPYAMILGTHRQPNHKCDNLLHTDDAQHIIIMCNNNFYKLCPFNESGVVKEEELEASLADIVKRSSKPGKPVGILTGNNRDTWAIDHEVLLELGNNKSILKDIENAMFLVCLDKPLPKSAFETKNTASVRALQCMTGFSTKTNASNRWHDKTVQFIVSLDGLMGLTYEHSPCEGVPIAVLQDFILKKISSDSASKVLCEAHEAVSCFPIAKELKFETNKVIDCAIVEASKSVNQLSEDIDMDCFQFKQFGGNQIKKLKMSPDSFVQIAMQVTYYRLNQQPPAHYESAALRRFANSRTECIRSTSCESVKFAQAMSEDDSATNKKKKELMMAAINAHKKLAGEAATGEGVDRHLFGMKMIAQDEGMELPEIFKDVGYQKSTYFTLTSSQVPYKSESFMCYGPVVPDGYGCCYNIRPDDIFFSCSSFHSCKHTNTKAFADSLKQALLDMRDLASS